MKCQNYGKINHRCRHIYFGIEIGGTHPLGDCIDVCGNGSDMFRIYKIVMSNILVGVFRTF